MSPQRRYELLGRLGRIQHGFEKRLSVGAGEHHSRMLVKHPTFPFIGEIARGERRSPWRAE
jgi:hypothetical protein